jgi:hypothetical protein
MGQRELSPALVMMRAMGAFQNRLAAQQRPAGELRKRDTHRSYPQHQSGNRERERHLRHLADGRTPSDQLGRIVDGRVVPL